MGKNWSYEMVTAMDNQLSPDEIFGLSLSQLMGRKAHNLGLDITSNPYTQDSEEWHAFNRGWLLAIQESHNHLDTAA